MTQSKKFVQHQIDDVLNNKVGFKPLPKAFTGGKKSITGYIRVSNLSAGDEETNDAVIIPEPLKHSYIIPAKGDAGTISSFSSHMDLLPKGFEHYLCSNTKHHEAAHPDCAGCTKAAESQAQEPGFKIMSMLDHVDNMAIDLLNCKSDNEAERKKMVEWREKLFDSLKMRDLIRKGVDFDAGNPTFFKRAIKQHFYESDDAKRDPTLIDKIGEPNLTKSPTAAFRIWDSKTQKDGATVAKEQEEERKKRGVKDGKSVESAKIYVHNVGSPILTSVFDYRKRPIKQIKNWDEFDELLVYEGGDAKAGKRSEFYLVSELTFILPMLTINKEKGARVRWTVKSIKVGDKVPIIKSIGPSIQEAEATLAKFDKFRAKLPEEERYQIEMARQQEEPTQVPDTQETQLLEYPVGDSSMHPQSDDELSLEERNAKKRAREGTDDEPSRKKAKTDQAPSSPKKV